MFRNKGISKYRVGRSGENFEMMSDSPNDNDLNKDKFYDDEESKTIDDNKELLRDIRGLCNRGDRQDVERILLFGTVGAGKSSVINTMIKALCGTYIPKAGVGQGFTKSKTFLFERYESCGISEEDIGETERKYLDTNTIARLPTIFDVAGMNDPESEKLEEILELLIGGYVPPGTCIEAMTKQQEEHGVGSLRDTIYVKNSREWRMTKVVFVHSCRQDNVPDKLIDSLLKILRKTDPTTAQQKYSADTYVLLTKYDLVGDENSHKWSANEPTVTYEDFRKVEMEIEQKFSIQGSLEDNITRWVSYTDTTGKDNPYIDNIALTFIKRMLMTENNKTEYVEPVLTKWTPMELKIKKFWNYFQYEELRVSSKTCVGLVIAAVIVLLLLYRFLSSPLAI